jgi:glyoxylase I family protein
VTAATGAAGPGTAATGTGLRWSHLALNCRDQRVTEDFYRRWFGFRRARSVALPDGGEIVFIRQGNVLLELFAAEGDGLPATADGPRRPGVARHLAFQTGDLDAFLHGIGDRARISLGPLSFDDIIPGWHSVWLLDPDGVVVEVSQGYHDHHHGHSSQEVSDVR